MGKYFTLPHIILYASLLVLLGVSVLEYLGEDYWALARLWGTFLGTLGTLILFDKLYKGRRKKKSHES